MNKKELAAIFDHFEDRVEAQYQDTIFYKTGRDNALKVIQAQNKDLLAAEKGRAELREAVLNLTGLVERGENFAKGLRSEVEEARAATRAANRDIENLRGIVSHEVGRSKTLSKMVNGLRTGVALANERGRILEAKGEEVRDARDDALARLAIANKANKVFVVRMNAPDGSTKNVAFLNQDGETAEGTAEGLAQFIRHEVAEIVPIAEFLGDKYFELIPA